ncbi:MAG: methyl-accepting chemotaxis protein, partial [Bacilli bacterium]
MIRSINKNIRYKLGIVLASVIIISISVQSFISISTITKTSDTQYTQIITENIHATETLIETIFRAKSSVLTSISLNPYFEQVVSETQVPQIERYFRSIVDGDPQILSVYYIARDGKTTASYPKIAFKPSVVEKTETDTSKKLHAALDSNAFAYTETYYDERLKAYMISIFLGVNKGTSANYGMIGIDLSLDTLSSFVEHLELGETGAFTLLDRSMNVISSPDASLIGQPYPDTDSLANVTEQISWDTRELDGQKYAMTASLISDGSFYLLSSMENRELVEPRIKLMGYSIGASLLVMLAGSILGTSVTKPLIRRLRTIQGAMEQIGQGNLSVSVNIDSTDELRTLGDSLNAMTNDLRHIVHGVLHGNEQLVDQSQTLALHIQGNVEAIEQMSSALSEVANTTTQQASETNELLSDNEQLNATLGRVSDEIRHVQSACDAAEGKAKDGQRIVHALLSATESSNETIRSVTMNVETMIQHNNDINNFLNTINAISSQTNLLSLNAS